LRTAWARYCKTLTLKIYWIQKDTVKATFYSRGTEHTLRHFIYTESWYTTFRNKYSPWIWQFRQLPFFSSYQQILEPAPPSGSVSHHRKPKTSVSLIP
jgi:hypothetical protein